MNDDEADDAMHALMRMQRQAIPPRQAIPTHHRRRRSRGADGRGSFFEKRYSISIVKTSEWIHSAAIDYITIRSLFLC